MFSNPILIYYILVPQKLFQPAVCVIAGEAQHIQRVQSVCLWWPIELILVPLYGRWNLSDLIGNGCVACQHAMSSSSVRGERVSHLQQHGHLPAALARILDAWLFGENCAALAARTGTVGGVWRGLQVNFLTDLVAWCLGVTLLYGRTLWMCVWGGVQVW